MLWWPRVITKTHYFVCNKRTLTSCRRLTPSDPIQKMILGRFTPPARQNLESNLTTWTRSSYRHNGSTWWRNKLERYGDNVFIVRRRNVARTRALGEGKKFPALNGNPNPTLKDKDGRHGPFTCTSKVGTGTSFRFEILLIVTSCKLNGPKMCEKSCLRGGRSGKWGNLSLEKVYTMFITITHLFRSLDVGHWHRQVQCTLHTNISCYVQVLRAVFQSYQLTHKLF